MARREMCLCARARLSSRLRCLPPPQRAVYNCPVSRLCVYQSCRRTTCCMHEQLLPEWRLAPFSPLTSVAWSVCACPLATVKEFFSSLCRLWSRRHAQLVQCIVVMSTSVRSLSPPLSVACAGTTHNAVCEDRHFAVSSTQPYSQSRFCLLTVRLRAGCWPAFFPAALSNLSRLAAFATGTATPALGQPSTRLLRNDPNSTR